MENIPNEQYSKDNSQTSPSIRPRSTDYLRRSMYSGRFNKTTIIARVKLFFRNIIVEHARKPMVLPAIIFAVMTIVIGFSYAANRQILRDGADDPQVQMVVDAAAALGRGASAGAVASANRQIDIATSLLPFLMIFDDQNRVVQSSGILNGVPVAPPSGVFNYVKNHGEDRITWAPQKGLRIAMVMKRVEGRMTGFVLAGRSLVEVEKRERVLFWQFFAAWVLGTAAIFVGYRLRNKFRE